MKEIIKILFIGIVSIGVIGCAGPGYSVEPEPDVSKINFGKPPIVKNERKRIISAIRDNLKDPYSAKIQVSSLKPERAYFTDGIGSKKEIRGGWVVKAYVNAKNSYGAYTGERTWYVFLSENDEHWHSILIAAYYMNAMKYYGLKTELYPGKFY